MSFAELHIEVFRWINDLGKHYAALDPIAVFFAEYMMYVLAAGMLVYWFTRSNQNRMMVIQAVAAFVLAEILGKLAGQFYFHNQPFAVLSDVHTLIEHDIDNSFPSDHTILFFSVCISFLLVRKKEGWLWLAVAICVSLSRIMVGVHYPIDVATGALFGWLAALVSYWAVPKLSFIKQLLSFYEKVEGRILPAKKKSTNF
ncbi:MULTISPECIES: undecaprenyl-diphosphatase [Brevibacillus]|jgi:undecaprenyl-diphosphatase|uniref:undecaprenyl-diphosphatase n=1 Tax=Brevibacillus TaxID=55080 RepID=UPI001D09FE77|nr:undecaprenyl-diphosphatase [Brevibacillus borstelensis]MCC0566937.1 undecaprenyl-diphosphatase [Brevibacillus borstelensis]